MKGTKGTLITIALSAAMFGVAGVASAQQPVQSVGPKADIPANLARQAKISESAARATALAKVPGATVEAAELEREGGKLLYSYDLKVAGMSGIQEVQVNAIDGSIVGVQHETPADMAKEAAADRQAAMHAHRGKAHNSAKEAGERNEASEGHEGPEGSGL